MVPGVYVVNGLYVRVPLDLVFYSRSFSEAVHDGRVHTAVCVLRLPNGAPRFDGLCCIKSELECIRRILLLIYFWAMLFTKYYDKIEFLSLLNGSSYELFVGSHNISIVSYVGCITYSIIY